MSNNNPGKYLEDQFEKEMKEKGSDVWYHRLPDSKSARNLIGKQPADFYVAVKGEIFHLECKSVKHTFRLKKFVQHPRMQKAAMAGMPGYVLVHFYVSDSFKLVNIKDLEFLKNSPDIRKNRRGYHFSELFRF